MDMFRRFFGQSGEDSEESSIESESITTKSDEMVKPSTDSVNSEAVATNADASDDSMPTEGQATNEELLEYALDGATRQLPLETVIASRNAHLKVGQSTDVGMVRTNNQDAMMTFYYSGRSIDNQPDLGLFIVADGMGGHMDGEKASAIVTRSVTKHVIDNIFLPMLEDTGTDSTRPPLTESLIEAIQLANTMVLADVPDGGTTVTAVAVIGDLAYLAHVGDSRAYLITKDTIEQITRDHSLVQRLIELDQLTPEEAVDHPQQNVLYRAIGQSGTVEVDALTRRIPPNSYLLICSDGLWGVVEDKKIFQLVHENADPQVACDKLVAMANTMGGKDNITAVMLHLPS